MVTKYCSRITCSILRRWYVVVGPWPGIVLGEILEGRVHCGARAHWEFNWIVVSYVTLHLVWARTRHWQINRRVFFEVDMLEVFSAQPKAVGISLRGLWELRLEVVCLGGGWRGLDKTWRALAIANPRGSLRLGVLDVIRCLLTSETTNKVR
jgi:hypothetical protein